MTVYLAVGVRKEITDRVLALSTLGCCCRFSFAGAQQLVRWTRVRATRVSGGLIGVGQVSGDSLLVPLQIDARYVRNMQLPILDLIGLLQDRICPILPLEPMRRFADPHDVSGHLGIEMGRDRNAGCGSDG